MRYLPITHLFLLSAVLASCQPPQTTPRLIGGGMDMFTPTKMRLHPLSRFILPPPPATTPAPAPATPPATMLEARIELTDQFGDPCKGAGTVTLQLFDESTPFLGRRPIGHWSLSLMTPEENRDHWDRTTRTYLFKLPLTADFPRPDTGHERFTLAAVFALPNGHALSDELELANK